MKSSQSPKLVLALTICLFTFTLLSCKQGDTTNEIAQPQIETETATLSTPQLLDPPPAENTATNSPLQPTIEPRSTSTPIPTSTPSHPTAEPIQLQVTIISSTVQEITREPTVAPAHEVVVEAQAISINGIPLDFSVFADGHVLMSSGEEFFVTPVEVEYLLSDIHLFSSSLWVANDLDLIQNANCENCPRIIFYTPIYDEFNNLVIETDIQLSSRVPTDRIHEIKTSATYTHNLIKLFLERVLGITNDMDYVFSSSFYEDGNLVEELSYTAYPNGKVILANGEEKNAPLDSILSFENNMNSWVFIDIENNNDEFRYHTTNCTDCFQITFFDYGSFGPITIEGDAKEGEVSHLEAEVILELEVFAWQNLE